MSGARVRRRSLQSRPEVNSSKRDRIFLQDPAVFVPDEATSAVDTETERRIQRALEDGRVAKRGSREELPGEDGHYARLWRAQIGEAGTMEDDGAARAVADRPAARNRNTALFRQNLR